MDSASSYDTLHDTLEAMQGLRKPETELHMLSVARDHTQKPAVKARAKSESTKREREKNHNRPLLFVLLLCFVVVCSKFLYVIRFKFDDPESDERLLAIFNF